MWKKARRSRRGRRRREGIHHALIMGSMTFRLLSRLTPVRIFGSVARVSACLVYIFLSSGVAQTFHTTTQWDLQPSLKVDAICALNMLSGDPYYLEYYQADYDRLAKQFRPEELAAFTNLKRRIKDQNGGIISASLALYFSASDAESLDDLIHTVHDSSTMRRNLQATPYYDDDGWKLYESNRPDLEVAFRALKRIHFEEDWEKNVKPKIEQSRAAIAAKLPDYNVIPAVEAVLGSPRPTNRITVYLLYYSQPHGIKITGTRFLTHYSYPFRIVLRNAIHEMMHPPYDLAHDPELRSRSGVAENRLLPDEQSRAPQHLIRLQHAGRARGRRLRAGAGANHR
jgi:hypothetical protein